MSSTRTETDLLGSLEIPREALWGIHTERALRNFPNDAAGGRRLRDLPELVTALLLCKRAAARVNGRLGELDTGIADAIDRAGGDLVAQTRYDLFPLHALHGGGGTSANMNVNEVLANLAEEALLGRRGEYRNVHPNDHVNRNQSTNDVYPTACRLAARAAGERLRGSIDAVAVAYERRAAALADEPRLARTCLQDALPITYGDFLGGAATMLRRQQAELDQSFGALHRVSLGGSAVGRADDVPAGYAEGVCGELGKLANRPDLRPTDNRFDAYQNLDDLVRCCEGIARFARCLIKCAGDLRLLGSGPEAGIGEITLPPVQAGSSMMPGKVNPVLPEFVIQAAFRVIGLSHAASMALDHGELDLNIWESSVIASLIESIDVLEDALPIYARRCVAGIEPVRERNARNVRATIPRLTEQARREGYAAASKSGGPGNKGTP